MRHPNPILNKLPLSIQTHLTTHNSPTLTNTLLSLRNPRPPKPPKPLQQPNPHPPPLQSPLHGTSPPVAPLARSSSQTSKVKHSSTSASSMRKMEMYCLEKRFVLLPLPPPPRLLGAVPQTPCLQILHVYNSWKEKRKNRKSGKC